MSNTKKVLRTLMQDHVGKHNAVTQSQLAESLGMNPSTLRSELRRLREEREIPIANLRDGYFVIRDKEELAEFVSHINQEIQSKRDTIQHTHEAFESFDGAIDVDPEPDVQAQTYECAKCGSNPLRKNCFWPKQGTYEDRPVCKSCFGKLTMQGEA